MSPIFTVYNMDYRLIRNSIHFPKFSIGESKWMVKFSNLLNLYFRQFMTMLRFSFWTPAQFIFCRIMHILFLSSQVEMRRSYARFVIAFMAYTKFFRDVSIFKNPRDTMSFCQSFIKTEISIPKPVFSSYPYPACRSFFDFVEESLFGYHKTIIT